MTGEIVGAGYLTRKDQKAKTRRLILDAAIIEFGLGGYEQTSIASIAKRADVSHGNIFAHFSTKDELFAKAIEEFGQRVVNRLNELSTAGAGIKSILSVHLKVISEFEDLYSQTVAKSFALPDFARQATIAIQSAVSQQISVAYRSDLAKGKIIPVPVHMLFNTWTATLGYYLANRDMFAPGGSVIDLKGEEILEFFMAMLSKRGE